MHNGKVLPKKDAHGNNQFLAVSEHNLEDGLFYSIGAAVHWLWLRDELFGSLAQRGALPDSYIGPAR